MAYGSGTWSGSCDASSDLGALTAPLWARERVTSQMTWILASMMGPSSGWRRQVLGTVLGSHYLTAGSVKMLEALGKNSSHSSFVDGNYIWGHSYVYTRLWLGCKTISFQR